MFDRMKSRMFLAISIGLLLVLPAIFVEAHTYHTTLTRIDYNPKEKTAEITIQIFTNDLIPTLEAIKKKPVDLEKTKDVDQLIFNYLELNFVLIDSNKQKTQLKWVGFENEVESVYAYLEVQLPDGLDNSQLKNTLFFERFPEESNLVIIKEAEKKADLAFKVGDEFKLISVSGE